MNVKESFQQAMRDRSFVVAFVATAIGLVAILLLGAFQIRTSEIQVPLRNTVFGITYTYREQWYNELYFLVFAALVSVIHTLISLKLYVAKDRRFALAFQWLTVVMLAIFFITLLAVFKVIAIVQ